MYLFGNRMGIFSWDYRESSLEKVRSVIVMIIHQVDSDTAMAFSRLGNRLVYMHPVHSFPSEFR